MAYFRVPAIGRLVPSDQCRIADGRIIYRASRIIPILSVSSVSLPVTVAISKHEGKFGVMEVELESLAGNLYRGYFSVNESGVLVPQETV